MVEIEKIFILNNEIKLEAEYFQSKSNKDKPVVLICHPHPQFGGNMFNNVVSAIFNILIRNDISCLRFNLRAVGRSNGTHSNGSGELSDVKACIDFLVNEKDIKKVVICGYSYGAAIGCSAVNHSDKVIGYIAISFPWDFMGINYKELSQSKKPKFFLQGDRDTIALFDKFLDHYKYYIEPKQYEIISGADHFYWGYEDQISEKVFKFYQSIK
ncbi:MAG: alpha/beta hydrolase [Candidatus Hodarchaeota archaeon]